MKTGQQSAILTKENPVFRLQDVIFRLFGQFGGFLKKQLRSLRMERNQQNILELL